MRALAGKKYSCCQASLSPYMLMYLSIFKLWDNHKNQYPFTDVKWDSKKTKERKTDESNEKIQKNEFSY